MPVTVAGRDLEAGERVDADGDHDVVGQRDEGGHGHLPLAEVGPDEEHHEHQEDRQAEQGALGDLLAPAGADLGLREVVGGDPVVSRMRPWRSRRSRRW